MKTPGQRTLVPGLLLLALVFVIAAFHALTRQTAEVRSDTITLRLAHFYLEPGLREAFDAVAADYARIKPHVRVQQIAVPERVFRSWINTQLVGETAPDLVLLDGNVFGMDHYARYFVPLNRLVDQPNPYNRDTALAGLPWRETFIDGLASNYYSRLMSYYGVPSSLFTIRICYNRTLWREMLGDTPPPRNYDEFVALCRQVQERSRGSRTVVPVAGSRFNAPLLLDFLFATQTQRLQQELAELAELRGTMAPALRFVQGRWGFDTPAIRDGLTLVRDVSGFMSRGFAQLNRDDANFQFLQGNALMIATGAYEAGSLRAQARFELGFFALPSPASDHPRFGRNMLGPVTEANINPAASFGIVLQSRHQAEALDFLHFLTSQAANRRFVQASGWLPAVAGVEPRADMMAFAPVLEGFPNGFDLSIRGNYKNARRVYETNQHLLAGESSEAIDRFVEVMKRQYPGAVAMDFTDRLNNNLRNVQRQDTNLGAYWMLARHAAANADEHLKLREVGELLNINEAQMYHLRAELAAANDR